MKRIIPLLLLGLINISTANAQDETGKIYSLDEYRTMALQQSKTVLISKEKLKMAEELRKAAFTQFLPNFSANATYMWNQKNISLLSEDALLPVGTKAADGSFSLRPDQVNNSWTIVGGQAVPLDADGKPFNPKTNPEKIQWKDYAYLPKSAMEYDIHNVFAGGVGFVQPVFMGNKIRELYNIAKSAEQVAALDDKQTERDIVIEVDEAYWRTVSLINKQKLAMKLTTLLEKLNSDVENMLKEGIATKGDLLNVRVKLNKAHLALTRAVNGLR